MKRNFIMVAMASLLTLVSCKEEFVLSEQNSNECSIHTELQEGMQRVVAGQAQLKQLLESGANLSSLRTRASDIDLQLSDNEILFVSLYDAQREKVLSSLTTEQLAEVMSDPEELEFEPQDSVIADMRFAQILNAEREIEVDGFVYKYTTKGVARVPAQYASELKNVEVETFNMDFDDSQKGLEMSLSGHISFIPMDYGVTLCFDGDDGADDESEETKPNGPNDEGDGGGDNGGGSDNNNIVVPAGEFAECADNGIMLYNKVFISSSSLRDITFKGTSNSSSDGNGFHKTFTGIWGQNVVALKEISSNRQVNLNLYDQEYIIYSNIGTKLKLQKNVVGIWWNVKAEEMVHGWDGVDIEYVFDHPIMPEFKNPFTNADYNVFTKDKYPVNNQDGILFTVFDFDFKAKYIWTVAKKIIEECKKKFESKYGSDANEYKDYRKGLFVLQQASVDHIWGPWSYREYGKKSVETKFYSKWFSGTCSVSFDINGKINLKSIKVSKDDHTALKAARVYGLVKHDGAWYGCRISKERED